MPQFFTLFKFFLLNKSLRLLVLSLYCKSVWSAIRTPRMGGWQCICGSNEVSFNCAVAKPAVWQDDTVSCREKDRKLWKHWCRNLIGAFKFSKSLFFLSMHFWALGTTDRCKCVAQSDKQSLWMSIECFHECKTVLYWRTISRGNST